MARIVRVAAAQMGPIQRSAQRPETLARMIALLEGAAAQGAQLVIFPELALTTFFPRWLMDASEAGGYFEANMPNPDVQAFFDRARELAVGFYLGYAELTPDGHRFNTSITVGPDGTVLAKYRKTHLPGTAEPRPGATIHQLEKRYFEYGDTGFQAFYGVPQWKAPVMGMLICNDRRWPEAWRSYGLQGVELMVMGYNSAAYDPNGGSTEDAQLRTFHSILATQSNAYMNSTWAVSAAKAGDEDGYGLIGGSCIVDPNGIVVAQAKTLEDEVIVADCDLDACRQGREKMFNFEAHRRPEHYGRLIEQVGVVLPAQA
ncbi:N-carbamoyl-D-amino-acid hydrolase [Xylophilus rhododendri]|uniref:N-carbamoyl-D-amino-acid hydrolase n=1 Tax=Xylophilus rhododendri TaxID=2697032 RepID=A0A857J2Z0_9BURK|nr:N-carbamoyl-D-amino-acid hydrolase [Xylophilus rhododendri]QHI97499.1 N-carbamoyl-D-amino-acid hydrolase [Xylophilus rhododendri]